MHSHHDITPNGLSFRSCPKRPEGFEIYYCVEYLKPTFRAETLFIFREAGTQIYEEAKIIIVKRCREDKVFIITYRK